MRTQKILILLLLISFSVYSQNTTHQTIKLNSDWNFTSEKYDQWYQAEVPGSIHTDLFKNELIAEPFTGKNENQLQWIDTLEWIYKKEFKRPHNLNPNDQIELVSKGLDIYAEVYLNDSLLLVANNMFLPWKAKIDQNILQRKNTLTIHFKPSLKKETQNYQKLDYELPGGSRVCTRKAAYQYGWDWAPQYVSCGIWQDVELHIWNKARIQDFNYSIEKLTSSLAIVNFQASIEATEDFTGNVQINSINIPLHRSSENISIRKGVHNYHFKVNIQNPQLWWTRNMGTPFLYEFEMSLGDQNNIYDSKNLQVGLRTIELIRKPDLHGESFYFKLNGIPVFMKGANYVPQSSFPGSVSDSRYKNLIKDVCAANMNMLRVWGGGIYEKDLFYELCDKAGILIWQDFMFANAMYPINENWIENIKKEASYQVNRLSKHPSIAVWCGNNEIDEAWHNWGWPENYSKNDSMEIWQNYLNIFHEILPNIVDTVSPDISYTPSSPLFGRGNPRSSYEGDNHYWYVWHDAYDFDWYNKVTGRFMSEFGFQSYPGIKTIEYFDHSSVKTTDSDIMLAHQKHHRGNYLIRHYMNDYYPIPEDFDDFVYVSQLLQAEGIRTGILAQRRAKPFCMGSLYWQLNDCWPAISWSSIDYLGNWKALHHFVKQDFKNIILSPYLHNDTLEVFVVSDTLTMIDTKINISLMDFYGSTKHQETLTKEIPANTSTLAFKKSISELANFKYKKDHLIYIELVDPQNKVVDSRTVLFEKPKGLDLKKMQFYSRYTVTKEGVEIELKSTVYIKSLFIEPEIGGKLSDNYFDLIPGKTKIITFKTKNKLKDPPILFKYNSVNKILNGN